MTKSFFRVFFSKSKEQAWLNKLGKEGYLLTKISDSKYHFTVLKNSKYYYSIEYLDFSPKSEMAEEYYKSRESQNVSPIITSGNWVYFCAKDCVIKEYSEIYKKNSSFYFWRCFYLLFFSAFGAILSGYQFFASKYLPAVGHTGDGRFEMLTLEDKASGFASVLNILKKWWNGILEILNDTYLKFLSNIFGENDTIFVQAWVIPLVIVLSVLLVLNFEQYLFYRKKSKCTKSRSLFENASAQELDVKKNNACVENINSVLPQDDSEVAENA